ncbi:hypothetical protein PsorP6_015926 [Peronosclerospora sorghi]|uniref:Uncharacterized protein n=1 Tax=Peronosclerospora sorghi TaxID=230839 RepID=A0ACC0WND3_9STRA|nr:hypothetical protein PsorP6_015926 [Peronosclerospora sorghi]
MPEFTRYLHSKHVFVPGTSDEERLVMFVLSRFPLTVEIGLPEFVMNAIRVASTVLPRLYCQDVDTTKPFLEHVATSACLRVLLGKPSALVEGERKQPQRVRLERLVVNSAALQAVEYTRVRDETDITSEWLAMQVQYDVTEHLVLLPGQEKAMPERRVLKTRFGWTFETEVTRPESLDWVLVHATPFEEKQALGAN